MARRSRATDRFRREVNARYPNRPTASDGWLGDAAHQARKSDHNPNSAGVVQAEDVTLTHAMGAWLFDHLRASRDPRIKYVIYHGQIFSSYRTSHRGAPWTVGPYSGINAHETHLHLSVQDSPSLYDDESPWGIADITSIYSEDDVMDELVANIQKALIEAGHDLGKYKPFAEGFPEGADGAYGSKTHSALVEAFKSGGISKAQADKLYVAKGTTVKIG